MALQSQLFRGDSKLEAAAVSDPAHILPGSKGPHVAKIQQALIQLDGAGISQDSAYGPATAAAVRAFKQKRQILNFQGKIDDIVGKKTIAALDAEMLAKEKPGGSGGGGLRLGFKIVDGDTPETRPIADVVVKFQGAFEAGDLSADSVLSGRRVIVYKEVPNQVFGNRVMQNPNNGRVLVRVGRKTNTIDNDSLFAFATVAREFLGILLVLRMDPGKIFILGSSSGGRNAIDFALHIELLGLKPHFVAAVDGAFFQADTGSRPEANVDRPVTIPNFTRNAGSTPNRHNFFQTVGNHAKRSLTQGVLFTSKMAGEEIHGTISGFQNQNLSRFIPNPLTITDDGAHIDCGGRGIPEAERLIADELLLRT